MTHYDVAVFKWGSAGHTARKLGLDGSFLGLPELLEGIEARDAKAAELLIRFFAVYDEWYTLSAKMQAIDDESLRNRHLPELLDKIQNRDDARQQIIAHLARLG